MDRRYQVRLQELLDDAVVEPEQCHGMLSRLEQFVEPFAAVPANFTSPTVLVPVGSSFNVSLQLNVSATAYYSVTGSSGPGPYTLDLFSLSDFSNTLKFSTVGPVFNLPEGYTINSPSAGIVDNHFVVPEPSTITLAALGLLGLGYVTLRTKHRQA